MEEFKRRVRAMHVLLTYQEQTIGMLKATDYVYNQQIFLATIRWGEEIRRELQRLESNHQRALKKARFLNPPPWDK